MKFTKEALSSAIKAKLTANGKKLSMSEKTLNDMVNNHYLFANEETELDEFVSKVLPAYESLEGNLRKDNSDFIKQWENEHPNPNPDKDDDKNKGSQGGDDATKALLARIEALENERKAEKSKQTIADKFAEIKSKAAEKGVKNSEWLDSYLKNLAVKEDSDVEAMADSALALFNMSNVGNDTDIRPGAAGGSSTGNEGDDLLNELAARRKAKEEN